MDVNEAYYRLLGKHERDSDDIYTIRTELLKDLVQEAKQEVFDDLECESKVHGTFEINSYAYEKLKREHLHPISDTATKKSSI